MPDATYSIEFAKTGRSSCKKCKEKISKGDMRMCVVVPKAEGSSGYDLSSYHHVGCFRLPRKFQTGSTKLTPEEFVSDHVEAPDEILPSKLAEIVQLIGNANNSGEAAKKKKMKSDEYAEEDTTIMGQLKEAYQKQQQKGGGGGEPKSKKVKRDETFEKMLDLYTLHCKTKADSLKDFLRWNKQLLTGHKDWVLFKVIDGEMYGRLGMCGLCGGRLKLQEGDEDHVFCSGRFDEESNIRQPCGFKGNRTDEKQVGRFQPWYTEEPTEEEKEAMDKLMEQTRGEEGKAGATSDKAVDLLKQAESMDWKLSNKEGIKKATAELLGLLEDKVDLPASKNAKMTLGSMVVGNSDKTPKEIVQLVIDKYGFKEEKEEKAAAKEAALEGMCENPKNAPLLMAFQELSQLYFKEGNRNAGGAYTRVVNAIKGLELEITADNAMSLSKGKTKIPNIGKASAEKMKEYMETGTIQKLEEKRADNA